MDAIIIPCPNCKKPLKQKSTKPQLYCGDSCRIAFSRKREKANNQKNPNKKIPNISENPNIENPNKLENPNKRKESEQKKTDKNPPGYYCQYCRYPITPQDYGNIYNLVSTCYSCVAERQNVDRARYPIHHL